VDSRRILKQLYLPQPAPSAWARRWDSLHLGFKKWVARRSWRLATASIVVAVWFIAHIHYYNLLTELECNVNEARAQIEAQQQRRYHIQRNMAAIVRAYSEYENKVLTNLTELRTAALAAQPPKEPLPGPVGPGPVANADSPPAAAPPSTALAPRALSELTPGPAAATIDPKDLLAQLKIVAEQYPELKLTQNLQQLSASIIASETEIAQRIMTYNDCVNKYTTEIDTFPSNLFAKISGFHTYGFYEVDRDKLQYREVHF
jgi:LemA protein